MQDLWKIFGRNSHEVMRSERRFAPKEEILQETGCVLGLRNISFTVNRGEFFVLMGLSGSGKSTLIRCLIRLIDPTSGKIIINGQDICGFSKGELIQFRRHTMGMVFQQFGLLPHYNVLDNVAYGLKVRGVSKEERYARALEAIETVGLKGWEYYMPSSLSGGMQQRVGMARALAHDPQILLLDEPFSGLDPLIRRQMQDELIELMDRLDKTMVFVTHDLQEALKLADRIVILRDGEVVQIGTPEEIITSPADEYVKEFVQDAFPAKVLTASTIMEDPELILYEWQGPKVARTLLNRSKQDYAFVLSKQKRLVGLVDGDKLRDLDQRGMSSLKGGLIDDFATCEPDTVVEELFPLATENEFPIAVIDGEGRFLGEICNRCIIECMIQDT